MRKFLFLLLILFTSSQVNAQFFKEFSPGSYYDTDGKKITGLIHLNIWEDHILFKADKDASKQKIKIKDLQSVLIYNDSLSVQTYDKDKFFAKLAINGSVKLFYKFESHPLNMPMAGMSGPGSNSYGRGKTITADYSTYSLGYLYGETKKIPIYEDGDKTEEITKKKFKEYMSKILVSYPETLKEVMDEKLKFKDLDEIVKRYYYGQLK
jgi:hypothetical protein